MANLIDEIPGYREAVESEGFNRDASFLDLTETICGVEVRMMTLVDFLRLDIAKSPFIHGGIPTPADVAVFLWALSPNYHPTDNAARFKFVKSLRKLPYAEIIPGIEKYIDEAFADAPGDRGVAGIAVTSWLAGSVDLLASQYHWPESAVLALPLKRLFQYQRRIVQRLNPNATFFNPSDRVRGKWLANLNGN